MTSKFQSVWQRVNSTWEKTRNNWGDIKAQNFEKDYWQPLSQQVKLTHHEIEELETVLKKAKRNVTPFE